MTWKSHHKEILSCNLVTKVLWTGEVRIKLFSYEGVFGEKHKHLMKRTLCQLLSMGMGVKILFFGGLCQSVAQETCMAREKNVFH